MRLFLSLTTGTAIVWTLFFVVRHFAPQPEALAADRIETSVAEVSAFAEFVPVSAQVVPADTVFLDSVEGGRVAAVHVEEGAIVSANTALVTLKNTDLELAVIAREAQYAEQLSNLARTQIDLEHNTLRHDRDLVAAELQIELAESALARRLPREETGVSQSEIDRLKTELTHYKRSRDLVAKARASDGRNAKKNLAQLQDSVKRMKESLSLLRGSLGDLVVTAPIAGQLTSLSVKVGEVVGRGARVGQVDTTESFKLRARVDEHYLDRLVVGQSATATVAGQPHSLRVGKIYPNVSNRQFEVDLAFEEPPSAVRRGQSLRVRIELSSSEQALIINNGPFYEQTGGLWLFVVSQDGKSASRRGVRLGRRNSNKIEVLDGLKDGETVLTSSYTGLTDKDELRLAANGN